MISLENRNITFASITENISLAESLIDSLCEEYSINEDHYGNILVAVTEAVTNAIQHGNKNDSAKAINISFESKDNYLQFSISDEGLGFDFTNLPDPTDPENIEKPHGRGIFLMKHLADKVEFENEGRTVVLSFSV